METCVHGNDRVTHRAAAGRWAWCSAQSAGQWCPAPGWARAAAGRCDAEHKATWVLIVPFVLNMQSRGFHPRSNREGRWGWVERQWWRIQGEGMGWVERRCSRKQRGGIRGGIRGGEEVVVHKCVWGGEGVGINTSCTILEPAWSLTVTAQGGRQLHRHPEHKQFVRASAV